MWLEASLLTKHLDGRLASADYLQTDAWYHLADIPSLDEAFCDLGTFNFILLHLFSAGVRHAAAVTDLLWIIEILEELHTEVQGVITPPQYTMCRGGGACT